MVTSKMPRKSILLLTIIALITVMSGPVYGKSNLSPSNPTYDYVALGDSLAVGMTPYGENLDKSYADYIAAKLDEEGVLGSFENFGEPYNKTLGVIANLSEHKIAIDNAEIITLDIGSDDILYNLFMYVFYGSDVGMQATLDNIETNIETIITTIKGTNSTAKIYVMGYYNALPYLDSVEEERLLETLGKLNTTIEGAANDSGATYIDTMAVFDKHLTKYLPTDGDSHPFLSGYKAIAKEFWDVIKADFLRGLN